MCELKEFSEIARAIIHEPSLLIHIFNGFMNLLPELVEGMVQHKLQLTSRHGNDHDHQF